jgi:hypothetical protein
MPRLTITGGPLAGQQFSFAETVVIGRGAYSDIRLDDPTVSRRHAEIFRDTDGRWRLRDLGSANGTLHQGDPLKGEMVVDGTTDIVFGEVEARLCTDDTAMPAQPGERSFPQLLGRLDLLATITGLPSRRDDPMLLIGLALDTILAGFEGCQRVSLFVARPGTSMLAPYARRSRGSGEVFEASAALGQACLRHIDGIVGNSAELGVVPMPPSVLAIPLILAGETLGALVAESNQANTWTPIDRSIGKSIGCLLAGLLDAERSGQPERRVAERDLLLARRVQQHFLPQTPPSIPGYQIAEAYVPARAVGGDHYDFFRYADDRAGLIIADVAGKAVSAALVMARFGMAVRLLASQASGPVELLVTLNILLLDELEAGMFVTAQTLALSPANGRIEIANAGHPHPLLRDASGRVEELALDAGAALGANPGTAFHASTFTLKPGTCLLLFTDGLNEAENEAGEPFGTQRAATSITSAIDARAALDALNRDVADFVGSAAPTDDLTLVLISRERPD